MLRMLLSVFLCISAILTAAVLPVGATEPPPRDAASFLSDALMRCEREIDLSVYRLTPDALLDTFIAVTRRDPYLFHVERRLSYTYGSDGLVLRVTPTYALAGEALRDARALVNDTVSAVCRGINPTWSDAATVLYLHDALLSAYAYDYRPEGERNYDIYGLFSEGVGVCQAFALAFMAVAAATGLDADMVVSDAMDHAWCHVRVGAAWYHVDVTRDLATDRSPASYGRTLRSDRGMIAAGYKGFACADGHACDSLLFEDSEGNATLQDVIAPAVKDGGNAWYAVDKGNLPLTLLVSGDIRCGVAGDVDLDGEVSLADLLLLRQSASTLPPESTAALREKLLSLNRPLK